MDIVRPSSFRRFSSRRSDFSPRSLLTLLLSFPLFLPSLSENRHPVHHLPGSQTTTTSLLPSHFLLIHPPHHLSSLPTSKINSPRLRELDSRIGEATCSGGGPSRNRRIGSSVVLGQMQGEDGGDVDSGREERVRGWVWTRVVRFLFFLLVRLFVCSALVRNPFRF